MAQRKFHYETNCVDSNGPDIQAMIDASRDITYATFIKHCVWRTWAEAQGYETGYLGGLKLKDDWHVRYAKSVFQGRPCYYIIWSGIENVFTEV